MPVEPSIVPKNHDRGERAEQRYQAYLAARAPETRNVPRPAMPYDGNTAMLHARGHSITPKAWKLAHSASGSTIGEYERERAKVPLIETLVPMVVSRTTAARVPDSQVGTPFMRNAAAPLVGAGGAKVADVSTRAPARGAQPR